MKSITLFAALVFLALPASSSAQAPAPASPPANVCLNIHDVERTETPDDRTIVFHMRDGKIWRNRLKAVCPMLRTSPFTQVLHGTDQVCSNQQFIHVTQTGIDCVLGEFTLAAGGR